MAAPNVKTGQRVEVIGKDGLCGTVAYVGATQFAPGKWIGDTLKVNTHSKSIVPVIAFIDICCGSHHPFVYSSAKNYT